MSRPVLRDRVIAFLDEPDSTAAKIVSILLMALIYLSIVLLVVEIRHPDIHAAHRALFQWTEYTVLTVFAAELVVRLICVRRRVAYLKSWGGIADVLAVLPGAVGLFVPGAAGTGWMRVLRLLRFARVIKFMRTADSAGDVMGGVIGKLAPMFALAMGIKGLLVALEGRPWWPELGDLSMVIGVSGFAIGIMLGTKLSVAQTRLYDVEDAVCRIVGALRDANTRKDPELAGTVRRWALRFERALRSADPEARRDIKCQTEELEAGFERAGIGGPNTANLHRDVEFVMHRALTRTPAAYERFLRWITVVYAGVVILVVPGLTGFFASALVIFALGGMYVIVDDMDRTLEAGQDSLIKVDLNPLSSFNRRQSETAAAQQAA